MKLTAYLATAFVALPLVMAMHLTPMDAKARMPSCALSCANQYLETSQCKPDDRACVCNERPHQRVMTLCVMEKCSVRDALAVKRLTAIVCNEPIRDKSGQYEAISNSFGIISAVFVIQRFAYKHWARMEYGLDDWFTLITLIAGVPSTVINARGAVPNGVGRDTWTLVPDQISNFGFFFYLLEVIYFAEVALSKLAFLFFYARIFPTAGVQRLIWGTVVFVSLYGVAFVFGAIFQCTPIEHYWLRWEGLHDGQCVDINALAWSNAIISIILDAWMLAVPLWQLRALKLDLVKKLGVGLMFSVGAFVTIVSIMRLKTLVTFGSDTANPTWEFFDIGVWSTVEINVALICACLPSLRLLLVRMFPKVLGPRSRSYAKHSDARPPMRRVPPAVRTTCVSRVSRSRDGSPEMLDPASKSIVFSKTFDIEYGPPPTPSSLAPSSSSSQRDEASLVRMIELELNKMGSEPGPDVSSFL